MLFKQFSPPQALQVSCSASACLKTFNLSCCGYVKQIEGWMRRWEFFFRKWINISSCNQNITKARSSLAGNLWLEVIKNATYFGYAHKKVLGQPTFLDIESTPILKLFIQSTVKILGNFIAFGSHSQLWVTEMNTKLSFSDFFKKPLGELEKVFLCVFFFTEKLSLWCENCVLPSTEFYFYSKASLVRDCTYHQEYTLTS